MSSPPAPRKVVFHILLCFPFSLWHGNYDKESSEEADNAKEEVGVVDVEGLHKFLINKIKNSSSSEDPLYVLWRWNAVSCVLIIYTSSINIIITVINIKKLVIKLENK